MNRGQSGVRADQKYSYRKLEALAASVRKQLDFLADQAIDQSMQLFEDLHEISIRRTNGATIPLRSGVIALENSEGYAHYDHEHEVLEILASETTYQRLEDRNPRASYFVVHELGHCILHTDQLMRLAQMPTKQQAAFHRGREEHKTYQDTEWQANAFASALLMPALGLAALEGTDGQLTPSLIAKKFGVSQEAAGYRLDLTTVRLKVE